MPHQWYTSGRPLTPTRPIEPCALDDHSHVHQWTRRRFLQTTAGAATLGAVVGAGLLRPGVAQTGLFWTVVMDERDVTVDLAAGTATLHGRDLHMKDYHQFENALLHNGEPPTPSVVSFTVTWTATDDAAPFRDPEHQYRGD